MSRAPLPGLGSACPYPEPMSARHRRPSRISLLLSRLSGLFTRPARPALVASPNDVALSARTLEVANLRSQVAQLAAELESVRGELAGAHAKLAAAQAEKEHVAYPAHGLTGTNSGPLPIVI